ncbi:MAG: LPS export ABC transporter periplasmic protein LptC [Alcanivorax sp.]|nr:LPS export ABC transporter periplasmic protein LptC [Alcanivorax sp.]
MRRQGLLSASGVLLLGLIVLMTLHEWNDTLPTDEGKIRNAPAIIAQGVTARSFNPTDGKLQYYLTADSLTQYDPNPKTLLEKPVLEMPNSNKGGWTIRSHKGEVRKNGNLIVFMGEVKADNSMQKVTLNTSNLRYFSKTNQVQAPHAVSLTFESGTTHAGALDANLTTGVLTLSKGVKSEFKAPPGS